MSVKDKLVKDDWKQYQLTEFEAALLQHVQASAQKQMASFLTYVANARLGYQDGQVLQFDLQFDDPERKLKVKVVTDQPQ